MTPILYTKPKFEIRRIDLAAVAQRKLPETETFLRGGQFLMGYFPPEERVPAEAFLDAVDQHAKGTIGKNPKNAYCFNFATQGEEMVGASSVFYLDQAATLFIGFIHVRADVQRMGVGRALILDSLEFAHGQAARNGKNLESLSGEVERLDLVSEDGTPDAIKRLNFFKSLDLPASLLPGFKVIDYSTGLNYVQPLENGGSIPLSLIAYYLNGRSSTPKKDLVILIESIYEAIYSHIPKEIYDSALAHILGSIPSQSVGLISPLPSP